LLVLSEHRQHKLPIIRSRRWGAPLVFEKLWQDIGAPAVLRELLRGRRFEFPARTIAAHERQEVKHPKWAALVKLVRLLGPALVGLA
jgi:hypothetical protein